MEDFRDLAFCIARTAIDYYMKSKKQWVPPLSALDDRFTVEQGVFTTLYLKEEGGKKLKGCIGYPNPVYPLGHAIARSSVSAAFHDPRFPPLTFDEIPRLIVHLEILSPIKEIEFSSIDELFDKIEIGKHGLVLKYRGLSGLLLPTVPVEYNWDKETYLQHLSLKAGLPPTAYTWPDVHIYSFTGEHFTEAELEQTFFK